MVEDIMGYNRIHEMRHMMIASESRANDATEAFGNLWKSHARYKGELDTTHVQGIPSQQTLAVIFKPLSGILNQHENDPF
jgi:hypothetical protein